MYFKPGAYTGPDLPVVRYDIVGYDTPELCRSCPLSLCCLAGKNLYNAVNNAYNEPQIAFCERCYAVHFFTACTHHICTNIRNGVHPRMSSPYSTLAGTKHNYYSPEYVQVVYAIEGPDGINKLNTPNTCAAKYPALPYKRYDCIEHYQINRLHY